MNEIQKRIIANLKKKVKADPSADMYKVGLKVPNCNQQVVREDIEAIGFKYYSNKSWDNFNFTIDNTAAKELIK